MILVMQGDPSIDVGPGDRGDLAATIRRIGKELGFDAIGFAAARVDAQTRARLQAWLAAGRHGEMDYMARHAGLRADPGALVPGTLTVISARLGYAPPADATRAALADGRRAYVSRYALGRDYHKVLRTRLQRLASAVAATAGPFGYRVFVDSAPVLEVAFAQQAGLGWRGKHTLLLDRHGSWNFIGEIYTDLVLTPDNAVSAHCGTCTACIAACPTGAIVAPYEVDARRCISYLTIELAGSIPAELRPQLGNRIYGCDDCQLACPWNRFARLSAEADFAPRHGLDAASLVTLFGWSASDFDARLAGSAIRRIGHVRWLRNIAVALGNAPPSAEIRAALLGRADDPSALVREHVGWALARQSAATPAGEPAAIPGRV